MKRVLRVPAESRRRRGFGAFLLGSLGSATLLASGCSGGSTDGMRGQVTVDGSSTVFPIAEAVSEEFQRRNPRVMVPLGRSGSGGGFARFCRGETDIATASRLMTDAEAVQCASRGVDLLEVPVALDGLSVIVNPGNAFVECLTVRELREIWRSGSGVRTWRDVRPEFPPEQIGLFGPGTDSGTFDTFTEAVVGERGASRTDYQASENDHFLVQGVTSDEYSLGYVGFAYLARNRDRLKAVAVDGGGGCVLPEAETILNGRYGHLGRRLYLYVNTTSLRRAEVAAFLEYFLTHASELIPETGFLPLKASDYEESLAQLRRLAEAFRSPPAAGTGSDPHE